MKHSYFISDLHLSEKKPELTALFINFIQNIEPETERVYILGDLFDFWVGDDEQSPLIIKIKSLLKSLHDKGVQCYFQHGNRDFLIGEHFSKETGVELLPEYKLINLYGKNILLCHGDSLCIDDTAYQKFRNKVNNKWLQRIFLCLPLKLRIKIAEKIRSKSNQDKQKKSVKIMDVNKTFTIQKMQEFNVDLLIHGHTHRENIHKEEGMTRIVLGDWRKEHASILELREDSLIHFKK